ncbi:MAG: flagellin [Sneathiella sp.]|nr:flagellin [Sneathiella sp.]
MAFSVNTNANAMAALRSLSSTQSNLSEIQNQIQSGLKVGGATDDPSTFVISQGMRGDIGALKAVQEGLNFGTATISMALSGATAISNQLTDLQTKVTQALNEGLDTTVLQTEADEMIAQITTIVNSTEFNGINLIDNAATTADLNVLTGLGGATVTFTAVNATVAGLGLTGLDLAGVHSELTLDNTAVFAAADTVTIAFGTETHIFEFLDENGGTPASSVDEANGTFVHVVTIDSNASTGEHVGNLATAMRDTGLSVDIAEDGTISVFAGGVATTATSTLVAGTITATDNVGGAATTVLDAAKTSIGTILTALGTFSNRLETQADFTQVLTDTLEEGLGILVDANLAEVSAKLQSEQTKEQLGIQSLSIANAASQSILGLFR